MVTVGPPHGVLLYSRLYTQLEDISYRQGESIRVSRCLGPDLGGAHMSRISCLDSRHWHGWRLENGVTCVKSLVSTKRQRSTDQQTVSARWATNSAAVSTLRCYIHGKVSSPISLICLSLCQAICTLCKPLPTTSAKSPLKPMRPRSGKTEESGCMRRRCHTSNTIGMQ